MSTENGNGSTPPFIIEEGGPPRASKAEQGFLRQATMLVGLIAMTLAMGGGVWLIWSVLEDGLMKNLGMALVGIFPIGLAYLAGWIFSILSIRVYNNLVYPLIIRYYSWIVLTGALVLYIKVIQKLFMQGYLLPNFIAYNFILLGILLTLFGLHLIPEEHDMRPYSFPIFAVGLLHLWLMITRYVFVPVRGKELYILGDVWIFALLQTIAGLMLAHTGLFNFLRKTIADFFQNRGKIFE